MGTFRCGHDRSPENSRGKGRYPRCRLCDNEKARIRSANRPRRVRAEPKKVACSTCEKPISRKNKTGRCITCISHCPVEQAKRKEAQRRRYALDPLLAKAAGDRLRAVTSTPEHAERGRALMLANRVWEKSPPHIAGSDRAIRTGRGVSATRMAWCPAHLRAPYRELMRQDGMRAEEARRLILEQHEVEMKRWRARQGIVVVGSDLPPLASVSMHVGPARRVLERASQVFSVSVDEIKGKCREQKFARPRFAIAHVLHNHGWSTTRIAAFLDKSDHTTAINWLKRAKVLLRNEAFDCAVEELEEAWSMQIPQAVAA